MRYLSIAAAIAAVSILGSIQVASAADMPVKAPVGPVAAQYNWTGFYIGGNVGGGWGSDTGGGWDSFVDPGNNFGTAAYFAAGYNVLPGVKPNGVIGGLQLGYNWQVSPTWVLGLVADLQASDMHASSGATATPPPGTATTIQSNSSKIDWFGTLRSRIGYAANNWLFYATGGLAFGSVKTSLSYYCDTTCFLGPYLFSGSQTTTNVGWAAGAGIELGLAPRWTVGVEYLHFDLGNISTTATYVSGIAAFTVTSTTFTANSKFAGDVVRAMLNYKF